MLTKLDRQEEIQAVLNDLQQDILMLRLMLFALDEEDGGLSLQCLVRMSDYLDQHIKDVCTLCGGSEASRRTAPCAR